MFSIRRDIKFFDDEFLIRDLGLLPSGEIEYPKILPRLLLSPIRPFKNKNGIISQIIFSFFFFTHRLFHGKKYSVCVWSPFVRIDPVCMMCKLNSFASFEAHNKNLLSVFRSSFK